MRRAVRKNSAAVYKRVRVILESARAGIARTVNTTQVRANWLIGREIVEEEQKGQRRAGYGEQLIEDLAAKLKGDAFSRYSIQNLRYMRQFYLVYPVLMHPVGIHHALRGEFDRPASFIILTKLVPSQRRAGIQCAVVSSTAEDLYSYRQVKWYDLQDHTEFKVLEMGVFRMGITHRKSMPQRAVRLQWRCSVNSSPVIPDIFYREFRFAVRSG